MDKVKDRCGNCYFKEDGFCYRNPGTVVVIDGAPKTVRPVANKWCGDHKPQNQVNRISELGTPTNHPLFR